jgi:hypothetical protein
MHTQSAPRRVPPVTVTPPIRPTRPWRVAAVNALPGFRLHVRFVDGTEGLVELADLVQSPGARGVRRSGRCVSLQSGVR